MVASNAGAEEIVAIVDLKFIEETEDTAAVLCLGDEDDDCFPWAVYYIFEARIDKVISGNLPDKRFRVLFGRHALKKKNFRNVIALFEERETDDPDEPQYRISQWGEKRTMYCFDYREDDDAEISVSRNDQFELNCYDQDSYQ